MFISGGVKSREQARWFRLCLIYPRFSVSQGDLSAEEGMEGVDDGQGDDDPQADGAVARKRHRRRSRKGKGPRVTFSEPPVASLGTSLDPAREGLRDLPSSSSGGPSGSSTGDGSRLANKYPLLAANCWKNARFVDVSGKHATITETPGFVWWAISDSHSRFLKEYFTAQGVNLVTIMGGRVDHARRAVLERRVGFEQSYRHGIITPALKAVFLLVGGNDLAQPDAPVQVVAKNIMELTQQIYQLCPGVVIVTGTVVSRYMGGGGDHDFIQRQIELDCHVRQACPTHHHFLNDVFNKEPEWKFGPLVPRPELMADDGVHLNETGRMVWTNVLNFVFDSVNQGNFNGRRDMVFGREGRAVLWKF